MSLFTQTLDRAIRKCKTRDTSRIIAQRNGYRLAIVDQGHGDRIILMFPGETESNPHMYLGSPTSSNLSAAKKMLAEFAATKDAAPRRTGDSEVAWQEFNNSDKIVSKRKSFKTKEEMEKFIDKLTEKDNFYKLLGTRDSKPMKDAPNYSKRIEGLKNEVKNKPGNTYVVYEISTMLGKTQETRGVKLKASTEAEAIKKYKQEYMKGPNKESRKCKAVKVQDSKPRKSRDAGEITIGTASEHKEIGKGTYYGYITTHHPTLGTFYVSFKEFPRPVKIQYDNYPWNNLGKLNGKQIEFIKSHEKDYLKVARADIARITIRDSKPRRK